MNEAEINLHWPNTGNMPGTVLSVRFHRALSSDELRRIVDIVEQIEAFRSEVYDEQQATA